MSQQARILALLILFPAPVAAQTPRSIPAQSPTFEVLRDSQWIWLSSTGHDRREAKLLGTAPPAFNQAPCLPGESNVTVCLVKTFPSGSTTSISTLCWPRGTPTRMTVLL